MCRPSPYKLIFLKVQSFVVVGFFNDSFYYSMISVTFLPNPPPPFFFFLVGLIIISLMLFRKVNI